MQYKAFSCLCIRISGKLTRYTSCPFPLSQTRPDGPSETSGRVNKLYPAELDGILVQNGAWLGQNEPNLEASAFPVKAIIIGKHSDSNTEILSLDTLLLKY
jgi:hypothetical protein